MSELSEDEQGRLSLTFTNDDGCTYTVSAGVGTVGTGSAAWWSVFQQDKDDHEVLGHMVGGLPSEAVADELAQLFERLANLIALSES